MALALVDSPVHLVVDIVVPVYNEAHVLERNIGALHDYLDANLPWSWRLTIADNASTDDTWTVARRLEATLRQGRGIPLERKRGGRALRVAWAMSGGDGVAFNGVGLFPHL